MTAELEQAVTECEGGPAQARRRRRDRSFADQGLVETVLARLAAGETLAAVSRDPAMPCWSTLHQWIRFEAGFAERFEAARAAGGTARNRGRPSSYHPAIGEAICERLGAGEPLTWVCAEPGMPALGTVMNWLAAEPGFAGLYAAAREVQAQRAFDEINAVIWAAEPGEALLTKVRVDALRWQAARLAARRFGAPPERRAEAELLAAETAAKAGAPMPMKIVAVELVEFADDDGSVSEELAPCTRRTPSCGRGIGRGRGAARSGSSPAPPPWAVLADERRQRRFVADIRPPSLAAR